jgi:hypothetical protein
MTSPELLYKLCKITIKESASDLIFHLNNLEKLFDADPFNSLPDMARIFMMPDDRD